VACASPTSIGRSASTNALVTDLWTIPLPRRSGFGGSGSDRERLICASIPDG
jgi:hypothetical protein